MDEVSESAKEYFISKFKNPYIASVISCWIIENRIVVFCLLYFDDSINLNSKVTYIHQYFSHLGISLWGFYEIPGIYISIAKSLFWGMLIMVVFNKINALGKYIYEYINNRTIIFLRKIKPADWRPINEVISLEKDLDNLRIEINSKNEIIDRYAGKIKIIEERERNLNFKLEEQNNDNKVNTNELKDEINTLKNLISEKDGEIMRLKTNIDQLIPPSFFEHANKLFKGRWKNTFKFSNGKSGHEIFTITDDNKYLVDGKHRFDIVEFKVEGNKIHFKKKGILPNDPRELDNNLTMNSPSYFEGFETPDTKVVYVKMSE